jgi:23S rRNA pseudouridine1911/1915/1917 synthase
LLESLRDASLIECILETGRTNQIRIHLSEQEHPIIGETIYMRDYCGTIIEANRLMLHAATLGFIHPISGKLLQFEDPNPIEFDEMLQTLR